MSTSKDTNSELFTLDIGGMTCASCVGRVEKALDKVPGIEAATVNLATEQARIRLKVGAKTRIEEVIAQVQKTGYEAKLTNPHSVPAISSNKSFWGSDGLGRVLLGFALSAPLFLPMFLMPFGVDWALSP